MVRRFYELDVQTHHSSGDDSVAAMVKRAERLGFAGIAITDYVQDMEDLEDITDEVDGLDTALDVRVGAKLRADNPGKLKELIRQIRDHVDILTVHGGNVDINRVACGDTRVDILAHPELMRKDSGMDHIMVKQAAENRVAIEINLRQLLETREKIRAHVLSHMRRNIRLAAKFTAPVLTSSGANTINYLRSPRDLAAFPRILGMDIRDSFKTVSDTPHNILVRADQTHDENTVQPGVRKITDSDTDE